MDNRQLDWKVAEALGLPIKTHGLCRADLPKLPKLFLVQERTSSTLDLLRKGAFGRPEVVSAEWSPSTSPAHALACLEAWCKAKADSFEVYYSPSSFVGQWCCTMDTGNVCHHAGTFCEAACAAIIEAAEVDAQEARNG